MCTAGPPNELTPQPKEDGCEFLKELLLSVIRLRVLLRAMNWMSLAVDLAREAMSGASSKPEVQPQRPTDLGTALEQQFAMIHRNMDAIVQTVNAHNRKLEAAIRRQRILNVILAVGLLIAVVVALIALMR